MEEENASKFQDTKMNAKKITIYDPYTWSGMATGPSHPPPERVTGGCEKILCRVADVEECRHVITGLQGPQQSDHGCDRRCLR